jgi:hypothetical protein
MVSTSNYLKTFAEVMPKRIEKIQEIFLLKSKEDSALKRKSKNVKALTETVADLQKIIGQDTFFQRAERKKSQSLRYYVGKSQKSLEPMSDYLKDYIESIDKKTIDKLRSVDIPIDTLINKLIPLTARFFNAIKLMDNILVQESKALQGVLDAIDRYNRADTSLKEYSAASIQEALQKYFDAVSKEKKCIDTNEDILLSFGILLAEFQNRVEKYFKKVNVIDRDFDVVQKIVYITGAIAFIGWVASIIHLNYDGNGPLPPGAYKTVIPLAIFSVICIVGNEVMRHTPTPEGKKMTQMLDGINWMAE